MRGIRILGLLGLIALAGCGEPPMTDAEQAAADSAAAAVPQPAVLSHTSVEIYPDAVEVRLVTVDSGKPEGEREVDRGRLTPAQRQAIEQTISIVNYGPGSRTGAACFVPHHFLGYYDASGNQVGEIAICFCCTGIRAQPTIDAPLPRGAESSELTFDHEALKVVLNDMGVPTDIACSESEA
jgi:hypothetical protein